MAWVVVCFCGFYFKPITTPANCPRCGARVERLRAADAFRQAGGPES